MTDSDSYKKVGEELYKLATEIFPFCRSITGQGVRDTLAILNRFHAGLKVSEIPTGTTCFDWQIPNEWNVKDAYIQNKAGERVVDFKKNNLHLVGYSIPFEGWVSREELESHLYSLPKQPTAIPYITSYYSQRWGFCLADSERKKLSDKKYFVKVDTTLSPGSLTYGEYYLPGETDEEILLSTYICHPSLGNNETSGICLVAGLAREIATWRRRKYSYRFVLVPETIGAIAYISKNLEVLRAKTKAGFQVTCVGDTKSYSYLPSRSGDTLADRAAKHTLKHIAPDFKSYTFLNRGSDERQYCSPGIDLPLCSVMRSRYATYPEYHTSLDNLSFISAQGLGESFNLYCSMLQALENNIRYTTPILCEPHLSKHGLYRSLGTGEALENELQYIFDLLAFADGKKDLIQIADEIGCPISKILPIVQSMLAAGVIAEVPKIKD